ncbi:MAG: hypothetical protein FWH03_07545 [Firmicutes bacterium]|nr:hypothetical protein [Bacillota bacterium]
MDSTAKKLLPFIIPFLLLLLCTYTVICGYTQVIEMEKIRSTRDYTAPASFMPFMVLSDELFLFAVLLAAIILAILQVVCKRTKAAATFKIVKYIIAVFSLGWLAFMLLIYTFILWIPLWLNMYLCAYALLVPIAVISGKYEFGSKKIHAKKLLPFIIPYLLLLFCAAAVFHRYTTASEINRLAERYENPASYNFFIALAEDLFLFIAFFIALVLAILQKTCKNTHVKRGLKIAKYAIAGSVILWLILCIIIYPILTSLLPYRLIMYIGVCVLLVGAAVFCSLFELKQNQNAENILSPALDDAV